MIHHRTVSLHSSTGVYSLHSGSLAQPFPEEEALKQLGLQLASGQAFIHIKAHPSPLKREKSRGEDKGLDAIAAITFWGQDIWLKLEDVEKTVGTLSTLQRLMDFDRGHFSLGAWPEDVECMPIAFELHLRGQRGDVDFVAGPRFFIPARRRGEYFLIAGPISAPFDGAKDVDHIFGLNLDQELSGQTLQIDAFSFKDGEALWLVQTPDVSYAGVLELVSPHAIGAEIYKAMVRHSAEHLLAVCWVDEGHLLSDEIADWIERLRGQFSDPEGLSDLGLFAFGHERQSGPFEAAMLGLDRGRFFRLVMLHSGRDSIPPLNSLLREFEESMSAAEQILRLIPPEHPGSKWEWVKYRAVTLRYALDTVLPNAIPSFLHNSNLGQILQYASNESIELGESLEQRLHHWALKFDSAVLALEISDVK